MPLDPAARLLLDQLESIDQPPISELTPEQLRASFELFGGLGSSPPDTVVTEDATLPGPVGPIPVRIYRPSGDGPLPLVVYFHGGGWVIGSIATHDPLCQQLAAGVPAIVVSVEYRLAPESRFPAAVEDSLAAVDWVAGKASELGGDPGRIAVAGDSAGGNLAAVVSIKARDLGSPTLAFQLLIYPATDLTRALPSHTENGEGYLLTAQSTRWFTAHYLGDADPTDPDASPLFVEDLAGLPPAFIMTAEFDPLRDEGEAYARRLREAGVNAEVKRYEGMIHGFMQMDLVIPAALDALQDAVIALRSALVTASV